MPRTREDRLIGLYRATCPGQLWLEVGLVRRDGGRPHSWPDHSKQRFLDGVLIEGIDPTVQVWTQASAPKFHDAIRGRTVHLLEAKARMGRYVVGQLIVGLDFFLLDYPGAESVRPVAVVGSADPAMRWAAERHGVDVWTPPAVIEPPGVES